MKFCKFSLFIFGILNCFLLNFGIRIKFRIFHFTYSLAIKLITKHSRRSYICKIKEFRSNCLFNKADCQLGIEHGVTTSYTPSLMLRFNISFISNKNILKLICIMWLLGFWTSVLFVIYNNFYYIYFKYISASSSLKNLKSSSTLVSLFINIIMIPYCSC